MSWHLGRMACFDLETTSAEPFEARIVESYVGRVGGSLPLVEHGPLLAAVEVLDEAAKIHGYTSEFLAVNGEDAESVVHVTASAVASAIQEGIPIVGQNVRYDLTVLNCELARHSMPPLVEWCGGRVAPVIDTLVLSKRLDRWRRRVSPEQGAHALKTTAGVFRIPWVDEEAHGARYDALISARVAWRMGVIAHTPVEKRPRIQSGRKDERGLFDDLAVTLPVLHENQRRWAIEQAASFQEFLRSPKAGEKRDVDAVISGDWPVQFATGDQLALTP